MELVAVLMSYALALLGVWQCYTSSGPTKMMWVSVAIAYELALLLTWLLLVRPNWYWQLL